jgi:hypothetical protein
MRWPEHHFHDVENILALAKAVQEDRHGRHIQSGWVPSQTRCDWIRVQFGQDNPNHLGARGNIQTDQFFNRQAVGDQLLPIVFM